MLAQGQKIIYFKFNSGVPQEIAILDERKKIPQEFAKYIRYSQPFIKPGDNLIIFVFNNESKKIITSNIIEVVRKGKSLLLQTKNSKYEIRYIGIDLGQVINHGPLKGCNQPDPKLKGVGLFPKLFS